MSQTTYRTPGDTAQLAADAGSPATARQRGGAQLTIVIPTLNECANISLLVARLRKSLRRIDWEVVFVDDDFERRNDRGCSRHSRH